MYRFINTGRLPFRAPSGTPIEKPFCTQKRQQNGSQRPTWICNSHNDPAGVPVSLGVPRAPPCLCLCRNNSASQVPHPFGGVSRAPGRDGLPEESDRVRRINFAPSLSSHLTAADMYCIEGSAGRYGAFGMIGCSKRGCAHARAPLGVWIWRSNDAVVVIYSFRGSASPALLDFRAFWRKLSAKIS